MRRAYVFLSVLGLVGFIQPANSQPRRGGNFDSSKMAEHATALIADLKFKPIEFAPPAVSETTLPTGALFLSSEDNSLPFLTIEFHFKGGTSLESVDAPGLWEAATDLIRVDGAGDKSSDQIAEEISRLGAKINIKNDYESWVLSLTVLKKNLNPAFAIVSDMLLRPKLSQEKLNVILDGMETEIDQRNNRPEQTAGRRLLEVLYPGSRRGMALQKSDLKKITRDAIQKDLKRRLHAGSVIVACAGDFRGLNVQDKVNGLLSKFPAKAAVQMPESEKRAPLYAGKILLVNMNVPQASISIGGKLPAHRSPDFYSLQLGNHILGGNSFNSRLMKEVRTKRGLAYYAMSYNSFFNEDGRFVSASGTRAEQLEETLSLMLTVIKGMHSPASEEEVTLARDSILNSLVFLYDDPESFLQASVRFRSHGLPADYLKTYSSKLGALSAENIADAMAKYVSTDNLSIVVVGPASLKDKLKKIRPVVVVEPEGGLN